MLKIVKIGGNVVDHPEKLDAFLRDFHALDGNKVLVHGGGKIATSVCSALGITSRMIDGRRVTDEETLKVAVMVYAGLVNKTIVTKLQALGTNAFGLCGADGNLIPAVKRNAVPVDFGFVGDPVVDKFGTDVITMLITGGYVPVIAPISHTGSGILLNTNADTTAQTVAVGMSRAFETELIYCFEQKGVLMDINDEHSVIPTITPEYFRQLKNEGKVTGGMIPKLENALKAIENGVKRVVICGSDAFGKEGHKGTVISGESA